MFKEFGGTRAHAFLKVVGQRIAQLIISALQLFLRCNLGVLSQGRNVQIRFCLDALWARLVLNSRYSGNWSRKWLSIRFGFLLNIARPRGVILNRPRPI